MTQFSAHRNKFVRFILIAVGTVSLVLGVIGIFLPLLPTTPFLLLTAACYAKSSRRFYDWLLANRVFGPPIRDWREKKCIKRKTKILAISMLAVSISTTAFFFVPLVPVKFLITGVGLGVGIFLYRLPVCR